jgi:hypothetical protein
MLTWVEVVLAPSLHRGGIVVWDNLRIHPDPSATGVQLQRPSWTATDTSGYWCSCLSSIIARTMGIVNSDQGIETSPRSSTTIGSERQIHSAVRKLGSDMQLTT